MDIENGSSVQGVYAFFTRKMLENQLNIRGVCCCHASCTRLRILLNTICRKPGFNSLRTPLNHGAEQASNETLKQTQQRNWSNASQGWQTAPKEHVAVLHYETASTTQQPRGEHRGTIKDCKIAGATTWQRQSNHAFTTSMIPQFSKSCKGWQKSTSFAQTRIQLHLNIIF